MTQITRIWDEARAKCDEEDGCRICGARRHVEAAHILNRKHDGFDLEGNPRPSKTWIVEPSRVIPLCGSFSEYEHHQKYDAHRLDLIPYLNLDEEVQAVKDAGGILLALRRISPGVEYRERKAPASPVLGDDQRERLHKLASEMEGIKWSAPAEFLRRLAQGEERA